WHEEWQRWDGRCYRVVPFNEIKARLGARIKKEFDELNLRAIDAWEKAGRVDRGGKPIPRPVVQRVTVRLIGDTAQALAGMAVLPSTLEQPSFLGDAPFAAIEALVCGNGILHLPSWAKGQASLRPPTPRFFSANALTYNFDATAPQPLNWLAFLNKL